MREWREGDVVRLKYSCSEAFPGRDYILHDEGDGLFASEIIDEEWVQRCHCVDNWILVKNKKKSVKPFGIVTFINEVNKGKYVKV